MNYKTFIRSEIEVMQDSYGNTERQACEMVLDLLNEDDYREALSETQRQKARVYVTLMLSRLDKSGK